MSLKRAALISAAIHMSGHASAELETTARPPPVPVHGVNVVLGGAMMSGIIIMVFLICYCCHRNQQKRHNNLPRYWRDPGLSMEVYTVEGQQVFEMTEEIPGPINTGPPPSYEDVVVLPVGCENKNEDDLEREMRGQINNNSNNDELPSYEAALRLAHNEGRIV